MKEFFKSLLAAVLFVSIVLGAIVLVATIIAGIFVFPLWGSIICFILWTAITFVVSTIFWIICGD